MELYELTVSEAAAAVRNGEVRAVDLARALIERHDALEPSLRVMAHFDPERLLAAASDVDRRLPGNPAPGPLAGVAVGVKDVFDCEGLPTACGIRDGSPRLPPSTAPAVSRLLDAGALVFGKTVTTDRAFLDPGPTRNPWNPEHTPGGSSSGSAAGVAARIFPAALGTQTAGSVIRPAAYCGVIGMTFTHGRVSMDGVLPLAPSFDTAGFFARSIDDAELLAAVYCGSDARGPRLDELPLRPLHRPVFLGFARKGFLDRVEDAAGHQALHAARTLQRGAIVHVLRMPDSFDEFPVHQRRVLACEAARVHRRDFERDPAGFGPKIAGLIEEGLAISEADYLAAREYLDRFRADMLARINEVDAIILPAATGGAPFGLDSTGDPLCNAPWTAIGFPAVTLPSGLAEDGLPLGLQIVGRPMGEALLLRMARLCIDLLGYGCPAPPVGSARA